MRACDFDRNQPVLITSPLLARLKEAGIHTVVYGVGSVLQTVLGFLLIPLYTRYYPVQEYGVLTLILLVATFAGALFYLGISSALARSYYDYADDSQRRVVFSTSLYLTLAGALLQAALGAIGGRFLSRALFGTQAYAVHFAVAFASSALTFVNTPFLMLLRFQRRSAIVVVANVLSFVVAAALILYLLIGLHLGVMAPLLGTCLSQAALCAALAYASRRSIVPRLSWYEVPVQLRFGLPVALIGLIYYALDSSDRFLIQMYGTLHDVGVYSLGYKIGMLIWVVLIVPFGLIWEPMRVEYRHDAHAPRLFRLIITYYTIIGMLIAVMLSVFAREIIRLGAGNPAYLPAYQVVPFVVLGHLAYGAVSLLSNGIVFTRKVSYLAYSFAVGLVINVALNLALLPRLGYVAAAYTTTLSYVVVALLVAVVSNRLLPIEWEPARVVSVLGSGVVALVLGSSVQGGSVMLVLTAKAALVAALVGVWYRLVLTTGERRHLRAWLRVGVTQRLDAADYAGATTLRLP